mmetsp:Transcript_22485/g.34926  ORF Transcript_22485/g.34926 Transcript_22485/m.34926 type:complete len:97 (+) Transcript_22485:890-1180(+)
MLYMQLLYILPCVTPFWKPYGQEGTVQAVQTSLEQLLDVCMIQALFPWSGAKNTDTPKKWKRSLPASLSENNETYCLFDDTRIIILFLQLNLKNCA